MTVEGGKPRALVLTRNLPPLVGGMERLLWHILDELTPAFEVHAVGPRGSSGRAPDGVAVREVPESPLWWFLARMKWKAVGLALKLRPKVVFAGSGLTAPFAWLAARLVGARAVVYLHGLDIEAQHGFYRALWLPFIRRCDLVLANSHFTRDLARRAGVEDERIRILHPGVDLPDLARADDARRQFRERHGLDARPVMLYVGRITERKGLAPFVEDILTGVLDSVPDARLVVIGAEPRQALLQGNSLMGRIQQSLEENSRSGSVLFLGAREHDDSEISEAYFAADVHVFPVQDRPGDNEGFGMVAVEAAAHGLPTVAFRAGGVVDAIEDGESGRLITAGDRGGFVEAVSQSLQSQKPTADEARAFAENFSWVTFGKHLREIVSGGDASHED